MRLLTRWWFAALLVCAIILAWSVTVAPWAPWHERTVTEVRLDLRAPADHPQTATSSTFRLQDARAAVTVTASRPPAAQSLPQGFMGSVDWAIKRAVRGTSSLDPSGTAAFTGASPAPVRESVGGEAVDGQLLMGSLPGGALHLTVTGVASAPAAIVVRVTQARDTVAGVSIPLVLAIACIVLIGIPATTARSRSSKPVIFPPTHEHY